MFSQVVILLRAGTWLGITRIGRIAAVTNYRDPASIKPDAPSRGKLVSDFLLSDLDSRSYLDFIRREKDRYNGFNLILGNRDRITWYSNRSDKATPLSPGVYGLSNHLLDTPWPKVVRAKALFEEILHAGGQISTESCSCCLKITPWLQMTASQHRGTDRVGANPLAHLHHEPHLRHPIINRYSHRQRGSRHLPGPDLQRPLGTGVHLGVRIRPGADRQIEGQRDIGTKQKNLFIPLSLCAFATLCLYLKLLVVRKLADLTSLRCRRILSRIPHRDERHKLIALTYSEHFFRLVVI